jgi:hypothetical protein
MGIILVKELLRHHCPRVDGGVGVNVGIPNGLLEGPHAVGQMGASWLLFPGWSLWVIKTAPSRVAESRGGR